MRVTQTMIYDQARVSAGDAADKMLTATQQASDGIRVIQPGDDPGAAALMVSIKASESRTDGILGSIQSASSNLSLADGALGNLNTILSQARQLAVQYSNASYSASDRANAVPQINSLLSQAAAILNTKSGSRYIFAGSKDNTPPFDAAGNYSGDNVTHQIEIAPGVNQTVSISGDTIAKTGTDIFGVLQGFSTALQNNSTAGISASLDGLDAASLQVTTSRSQAASYSNALDTATTVNTAVRDAATKQYSNISEVDEITAATNLQMRQNALQATLTAVAQSFKFSLVDKLPI